MQDHQRQITKKKERQTPQETSHTINNTQSPINAIQRASISPQSLTLDEVMSLQNTVGNRAVAQLFQKNSQVSAKTQDSTSIDQIIQRTIQRAENNLKKETQTIQRKSGLPDKLKNGLENMSGMNLSDVNVHYNSPKPASVGALAYAQNNDIFLGRGQEKHLAHEGWHVVQQKQGRVKPTTSFNGVSINDDKHLEREADVMGAKALSNQVQSNIQLKKKRTLHKQDTPPLQRKVEYKNPNEWMIHEIKAALKEKIYKRREELFSKEEQATVTRIFEDEYFGKLFNALSRLSYSEVDYGTFNLDSDQHLLLLYYEIKKHLDKPKLAPNPEKEVKSSEEKSEEEKEKQKKLFAKSPYPGLTYELAILGAGAAAAYYLTSNKVDKYSTVVIGETQPWAGQRGSGKINHPEHMITALREEVGLKEEELMQRADFSHVVEDVINKYVIHRRNTKIKKVAKVDGADSTKFYEIEIQSGVKFYAQKVIVGLGIGPHKKPSKQKDDQARGRVMNMDDFQKQVDKGNIKPTPQTPKDITIVVGGGNAGIDSVMTSIRKGYTIIWATGSKRPALLPGTDNEYVEEEYEAVINSKKSKIKEVIKNYANNAVDNPKAEEDGQKPIIVNTGGGDRFADYFVYALGPDTGKISDLLDENSIRKKLEPTYDKNRQFGDDGLGTVTGLEVTDEKDGTSLEIIGGTAFRMASDVKYNYMEKLNQNQLKEAVKKMEDLEKEVDFPKVKYAALAKTYQQKSLNNINVIMEAELGKPLSESLLETVKDQGATKSLLQKAPSENSNRYLSCLRFIDTYESLMTEFFNKVQAYLKKNNRRAPDPRVAGSNFAKVVETLPLNVAVNDQLTTIRSQVEANAAFVPDYVIDDVNFATDSMTVLSIYISTNYPNLPDREVDMWVDRIIRWRRPSEEDRKKYKSLHGPLPNPLGKPRENARSFSAWFKKRLNEENQKYS